MSSLAKALVVIVFVIVCISSCVKELGVPFMPNSDCDEPMLDYNNNGESDAEDYDIMRKVENDCENGY